MSQQYFSIGENMPARDLYLFADDPESEIAAQEIELAISMVITNATSSEIAKRLYKQTIQPILNKWSHVGAADSEPETEVAERIAVGLGKKFGLTEDEIDSLANSIRFE